MSWADMMKAAALDAGRRTPTARSVDGATWTWNPRDVWLTRVRKTRESIVEFPERGASAMPRQDRTHSR